MPLRVMEPPEAVQQAAAKHVHELATPRGVFPALRDVVREELVLTAPLDALLQSGLDGVVFTGWRYLVADRDRIVASAEVAGDTGESPLLNGGPYVASTATAIDELEQLPEVTAGDFELRLLKIPALHIAAAWLVGDRRLVVPLAPAPRFLDAGRPYPEADFAAAIRRPAEQILAAEGSSGG